MSYLQKNEQQSILPQMPYADACRASDTADFCDLIVRQANAALPRVTGLSQAEPEEVSALPGFDPIPQETQNDPS